MPPSWCRAASRARETWRNGSTSWSVCSLFLVWNYVLFVSNTPRCRIYPTVWYTVSDKHMSSHASRSKHSSAVRTEVPLHAKFATRAGAPDLPAVREAFGSPALPTCAGLHAPGLVLRGRRRSLVQTKRPQLRGRGGKRKRRRPSPVLG